MAVHIQLQLLLHFVHSMFIVLNQICKNQKNTCSDFQVIKFLYRFLSGWTHQVKRAVLALILLLTLNIHSLVGHSLATNFVMIIDIYDFPRNESTMIIVIEYISNNNISYPGNNSILWASHYWYKKRGRLRGVAGAGSCPCYIYFIQNQIMTS